MDYVIEKMEAIKIIGFEEEIPMERGYELCPKMWERLTEEYFDSLWKGKAPETDIERAILDNGIGAFGVCVDNEGGSFAYMVGGAYKGGPVPEGMRVREIPSATWARFKSTGPMPEGLQSLNTQIFSEWLPGNREYDLAFPINIEYYECGGEDGMRCEIWLPVEEKKG